MIYVQLLSIPLDESSGHVMHTKHHQRARIFFSLSLSFAWTKFSGFSFVQLALEGVNVLTILTVFPVWVFIYNLLSGAASSNCRSPFFAQLAKRPLVHSNGSTWWSMTPSFLYLFHMRQYTFSRSCAYCSVLKSGLVSRAFHTSARIFRKLQRKINKRHVI